MNDLFSLGYKKPLDENDLPRQPYADTCEPLSEKFEKEWEKESLDVDGKLKEDANLLKVFWKCFGLQYAALGILVLFSEGLRVTLPILLGLLVRYFEPNSSVTKTQAYLYAMAMLLCSLGITLNNIPLNFIRQRIGMQARIAATTLVYKKVLRLSHTAMAKTTTGYIVNLIASDAQKLDFACFFSSLFDTRTVPSGHSCLFSLYSNWVAQFCWHWLAVAPCSCADVHGKAADAF